MGASQLVRLSLSVTRERPDAADAANQSAGDEGTRGYGIRGSTFRPPPAATDTDGSRR